MRTDGGILSTPSGAKRIAPESIEPVARLHTELLGGDEARLFGPVWTAAMIRWYLAQPSGIALWAGGTEPAGYVLGVPLSARRELARALAPLAAKTALRRPWILARPEALRLLRNRIAGRFARSRLAPAARSISEPVMFLAAIAVAPSARGIGAGAALLAAFEERSRALGMGSMLLTVDADNGAARTLYERHGWAEAGAEQEGRLYYAKRL